MSPYIVVERGNQSIRNSTEHLYQQIPTFKFVMKGSW